MPIFRRPTTWFILGLITAVVLGLLFFDKHTRHAHHHSHDKQHPIGYADSETEVHVHSDWLVHIAGTTFDFSGDQYQTTATQELSKHIHLHDNNGLTIHRHADGVTLAEFLASLGFTLTDSCITTDQNEVYCSDAVNALVVYVNGTAIDQPSTYINQEADRILIYYGDPNATTTIADLQATVSDVACVYSGTCPERGIAPPESCGLTCEL